MPIESAADRLAMLTEFRATCNFACGEVNWDAYGIADRQFVEVLGLEGYRTTLTCRTTDIFKPGTLMNDANRATSVNVNFGEWAGGYTIMAYERDGTGMTMLVLEALS